MSEPTPFLHVTAPEAPPRAIALVLHGGRVRSSQPTRAAQLAVVRMAPFVTGLHRAGASHGLVVANMRYLVRGWNAAQQSPVADVRWALDQLADQHPNLPVALVGHSMGGRAACYAAGYESVRAVVGLAPWIDARDPYEQFTGRRLLVLHGELDRITSPVESARYVREAAAVTESAGYLAVRRDRHAMMRRPTVWHELTTGWVVATMCDVAPADVMRAAAAATVQRVVDGAQRLTV